MKKIAIITLQPHTNFGGILQAYALQTTIEQLGYEAEILLPNYVAPLLPWFKNNDEKEVRMIMQHTDLFIAQHLHTRLVDPAQITESDYQGYVVGSDQIWRYIIDKIMINSFTFPFLDFTKGWDVKRIAYAPSFGLDTWEAPSEYIPVVKELLEQFDAISVREDSGVTICKEVLGVEADVENVIDPTLLVDPKVYDQLIEEREYQPIIGDMACYVLNIDKEKQKLIDRIAQANGVKPFSINSKVEDETAPVEKRIQIPVQEWLKSIRYARFVVTDSFHATMFSILFHRPFVVTGNPGRGLARLHSILKALGLERHLVLTENDYDSLYSYEIPDSAYERLETLRSHSKSFLEKSLQQNSIGMKSFPLSASQMKFYQDYKDNSNGSVGNMLKIFKFSNNIDVEKLNNCIVQTFNNHTFVRLRIQQNEKGEPYQYIDDNYYFTQQVEQLSDAQFEQMRPSLVKRFDLYDKPLFYSRLLKTESAVYWLYDIHHILTDASSKNVIYADINSAWQGQPLEPEMWSPCNLALEENKFKNTNAYATAIEKLKENWRECVGVFPKPNIFNSTFGIGKVEYEIDINTNYLSDFAKSQQSSLSALSSAACSLLLSLYTGQNKAALVTAFNGRNNSNTDHSVGMFSRYLLFNVPWSKEMSVKQFLAIAFELTNDARNYGMANLDAMEQLNKNFVDYMPFIFQGRCDKPIIANEQPEQLPVSLDMNTDFKPFHLHIMFIDGKMIAGIFYQSHRYTEDFALGFAKNFEKIIKGFTTSKTIGQVIEQLQV